MASPDGVARRPLAPGDKPGHHHTHPKAWLRQRVKPPHLAEYMWLAGEDHGGVLCGYLRKTFWPQVGPRHKDNWHTRWFALDKDRAVLYYYKAGVDPEDLHETQPRGWITLSASGTTLNADIQQADSSGARQFHLSIPNEKKGTQEVKFRAPSEDAYREWVTALREVLGQTKPRSAVPADRRPSPALTSPDVPRPTATRPAPGPGYPPAAPAVAAPEATARRPAALEGVDVRLVMLVFSLLVLLPAIGGVLSALLVFTLGNGSILASNLLATNVVGNAQVTTLRKNLPGPQPSTFGPFPTTISTLVISPIFQAVAFNAVLALVLFGGPLGVLLPLLGGNAALWKTLSGDTPKPPSGVSARWMDGNAPRLMSVSDGEGAEDESPEDEVTSTSSSNSRPTPLQARAPMPVRTPSIHAPRQLRHVGGQSLPRQQAPTDTNCWALPDPASFNVRVGPDYARLKCKAPSQGSILTPVAADLFTCAKKVDHIMQYMQFPSVDFEVAHWFVINAQVCNYPPGNPVWGSAKLDGPGMSVVVFNPIPPALWQQIQQATSGHLELLRRFLTADRLPDPEVVYNRSKLVATLVNAEDPALQLNATCAHLVKSWNSKPVLTRPQHRIIHADLYTELDINLHEFSYLARRGLAGFINRVKCMELNVALVLEAQTDAELPEVVLTCFTLNRVDLERGKPW